MKTLIFCFACFCVYVFYTEISPPKDTLFPKKIHFTSDTSVSAFVEELHNEKIVKNRFITRLLIRLSGNDRKLKPTQYVFNEPQNVFKIVNQIVNEGQFVKGIRLTIPEGSTVFEIRNTIKNLLPTQSVDSITSSLKVEDEGYLFPDTYYISKNTTPGEISDLLKSTWKKKTSIYFKNSTEAEINKILTMASLLEKEGKTEEERKMISGILWKRLEIGMPLQVDATFLYTIGKGSSELSLSDLKNDNPYNTYTRKGLPVGPINNPGIETIEAAIYPKTSPYLFYLHDSKGQIHYARSFEEHKINKQKYLQK